MRVKRILGGLLLLAVAGAAGFTALAWRSELDPVSPPGRSAFPPEKIAQGARLAALGYCAQCHTAPGGKPFAGGYPLKTPFGTIYGTNITPDPETGIGSWSEEAFARAMGEGVDREGHHLYPGFPYDHFTRITADDNRALYAYLMTREPVRAEAPVNDLPWPLQFRPLLAGWKLLFLDKGEFQPDPARSPEWNRGAYLAEGVAHCGACHTPRNALGARETSAKFAGGESEGWHAPALNEASTAPVPWDQDSLYAYLRTGVSEDHALAAGPDGARDPQPSLRTGRRHKGARDIYRRRHGRAASRRLRPARSRQATAPRRSMPAPAPPAMSRAVPCSSRPRSIWRRRRRSRSRTRAT